MQEPHQFSGSSYEFFEQIGEDDWSVDHAAYDPQLNRDVMIRVLRPEFAADRSVADEFWNRAICLAQVEQTHIARIYSVDRARGWIVMERLTRSVEDQLAASGPLTASLARDLMKQALTGLAAFHDRGEVHGGVCLSSLKYAADGTLKLTDANGFTPARELSLPRGQQRQFAPEMASSAEFGNIGPATDLYCLGFAILQTLLGKRFDAIVDQGVLNDSNPSRAWFRWHASARQNLAPVEELLPELPEDLRNVLSSMTQKRVANRPQSAREVLHGITAEPQVPSLCYPASFVSANSVPAEEAGPGAVMVGRVSSVYSDAAETPAETDWLTLLTDIDWIVEQARRPQIFGIVAALFIAMFGLLLLAKPDGPDVSGASVTDNGAVKINAGDTPDSPGVPSPPPHVANDASLADGGSHRREANARGGGATALAVGTIGDASQGTQTKAGGGGVSCSADATENVNEVSGEGLEAPWESWPIYCGPNSTPDDQANAARLIHKLVDDAPGDVRSWEQRKATYDELCKLAYYDPRVHYAFGLTILKNSPPNTHGLAVESFVTAMDVQQRRKRFATDDQVDGPHWYLAPERERIRLVLNLLDREDRLAELSESLVILARRSSENSAGSPVKTISQEDHETSEFIGHCYTWMYNRFDKSMNRTIELGDWSRRLTDHLSKGFQTEVFLEACSDTEERLRDQRSNARRTRPWKGMPFDQIRPPDLWHKCDRLLQLISEPCVGVE
ncbi:MAG: hypothetical protein KDA52_01525 [Planctomycetaceae bacterium]|nr:hypothetical protein [Planctomycetaceae bacterium]